LKADNNSGEKGQSFFGRERLNSAFKKYDKEEVKPTVKGNDPSFGNNSKHESGTHRDSGDEPAEQIEPIEEKKPEPTLTPQ